MKRPLLDYLLGQIEQDYASALEKEIHAAAEARQGHAVAWSELDRRSVVYFAGPGVYEVMLDEQPLVRIEHIYGITCRRAATEATLTASPLRVVLLSPTDEGVPR